ncbi:MAG: 23S rRNA (adenine(2030)-N(6))-methyltransferase RlmJ [Myxococcota bacterium]
MNYDHRYHAGNPADVVKHAALSLVLEELVRKDGPLAYFDTHAGAGVYRLDQDAGEWKQGVGKLLSRSARRRLPELSRYLDLVREGDAGIEYPGSPSIASALLRPSDRLILFEAHKKTAEALREALAPRPSSRVSITVDDGYAGLLKLKLREERLIALIDPPFEKDDEWDRLEDALLGMARRSQGATLMLWYPLKAGPPHEGRPEALRQRLERAKTRGMAVELRPRGGLLKLKTDNPRVRPGLRGTGLVLIEAPGRAIARWFSAMPELARSLGRPEDDLAYELTVQGWG